MSRFFLLYTVISSFIANRENEIKILQTKTGKIIIILSFLFLSSLLYIVKISFPYFSNEHTLFNIDANSEYISITHFKNSLFPTWKINSAKLYNGCGDNPIPINGILSISNNATIEVTRIEQRNLHITLNTEDFEPTGNITTNLGEIVLLSDCAEIIILTNEQSYIFPIDGIITLGHQIAEHNSRPPVLKSGQVYVADKRIIDGKYYQNKPFSLRTGDRFYIENPTTQASGFIYIDKKTGFDISYRVKGKHGIIQKYKSEPIIVINSVWDKIFNDDFLAIF